MRQELEKTLRIIERTGGKVDPLVYEAPAKESEIIRVENNLGCPFPYEFRNTLLHISSHVELNWSLPDEFKLPTEFKRLFSGNLFWGLDHIIEINDGKEGLIKEVFPNPEDECHKVWYNKFAFQEVGNGDLISIDISRENYGKVIYLSHDDGEGHGYVMAQNFIELLIKWSQIAFVGAEDSQWIHFVDDNLNGINPNCQNAVNWRRLLEQ